MGNRIKILLKIKAITGKTGIEHRRIDIPSKYFKKFSIGGFAKINQIVLPITGYSRAENQSERRIFIPKPFWEKFQPGQQVEVKPAKI